MEKNILIPPVIVNYFDALTGSRHTIAIKQLPVCIFLVLSIIHIDLHAQQRNRPAVTPATSPVNSPLPGGYGSNTQINYIRTWQPNGPITDPNAILSADYRDVLQSTQYVDGLGRPIQAVMRRVTPGAMDLVGPVVYDEFGRQTYQYMPYPSAETNGLFKTDPFNAQQAFMQTQFPDENVFSGKIEYEASPLNRPVKTMAPGNNWAGSNRGVSMQYLVNTTADAVRIWNINSADLTYLANDVTTNIPYNAATPTYNAGELYKYVTFDDVGKVTVEYKDKEGLVLLKKVQVENTIAADYSGYDGFLCTYHVYDDLNQLRFVIPPKAVKQLSGNNWSFTNDIINELCFRYEYDNEGKLIAKKVPGAGWMYMVYDGRDRLVFMQDANQRNNNQWMVNLYDGLNRPIMTGFIVWSGNRTSLQDLVTRQTTTVVLPPGLQADLALTGVKSGIHQASNSITLLPDFEGVAELRAEILIGNPGGPVDATIEGMVVNSNPIPPSTTFTALTKTWYDNYDFTNRNYTNQYNAMMDVGTNRHPEPLPSQKSTQTMDLVTGREVRIINDAANLSVGNWLTTVNFYDNLGQLIQVYNQTHKGFDVTTTQYNFSGKIICSYIDHNITGANAFQVKVRTSYLYDHAGRLLETTKTLNDDNSKKSLIARYMYNEMGQLKSKQLGHKKDVNGNYTASTYDPVETLDYSYNVRGWMTGINKDYANGITNPNGNKPWFGMELSYDKGFEKVQYTGSVAGTKWRSKGDGAQRAYGFTYDNTNRILGADFTQLDGSGYTDHPVFKFDMEMGDGVDPASAYDENGNIRAMKQWGMKLGNSALIDNLEYEYIRGGNKLRYVKDKAIDASGIVGGNWGLGDFTDKNKNGDDYGYDANGNMITDLNRQLTGNVDPNITTGGAIVYNYMNLPWKIEAKKDDGVTGKGTITYTYDAAGNKLEKKIFERNASVAYNNTTYTSDITTVATYLAGFNYESKTYSNGDVAALGYSDKLQFIGKEEGRIRYKAAEGAEPAKFDHDYFVKDDLGNIRMVLTEEQKTDIYRAGMEVDKRSFEVALFGDKITTTEKEKADLHGGFDTDADNKKVSLLNGSTAEGRVGPGVILKVMAGDKIKAFTYAWYQAAGMDNNANPNLTSILANLLSQLTPGVSRLLHETVVGQATPGLLQPGMMSMLGTQSPAAGAPKAYLNWVLLDEKQFKMIDGDAVPVPVINDAQKRLLQSRGGNDIEMTQNGYLYVFVSNESQGNVYFDDIRVEHIRGAMLEETHYYPFGLAMHGISSKAFGLLENKHKFNGGAELENREFSDGSGLDLYATDFRKYDPQIGRFHQIDLLASVSHSQSPYAFVGNNPLGFVDPLGLDTVRSAAMPANMNVGDVWVKPGENGAEWYYTYDPENEDAAQEGDLAGFVSDGVSSKSMKEVVVTNGKKAADPAPTRAAVQPAGRIPRGIIFGKNANASVISQRSLNILAEIMRDSDNPTAVITSTARSPESQARAMYANIVKRGVKYNLELYGANGDRVINVAARSIKNGDTPEATKAAMVLEIQRLGPGNVSRHCGDPNVVNVMDIDPGSIRNRAAFVREIRERGIFLIPPPVDPVYHIQITQ